MKILAKMNSQECAEFIQPPCSVQIHSYEKWRLYNYKNVDNCATDMHHIQKKNLLKSVHAEA